MIRGKKHLSLCLIFLAVSTVTLSGRVRTTRAGTSSLTTVASEPIPVQSGYDGNEQFCGTLGKVQYVAIKYLVHFNLNLAAMKEIASIGSTGRITM